MIKHLGRYEIVGEIARGAMGIIYKAKDPLIDRMVAIKTINLRELDQEQKAEYEARFYLEAQAAGKLSHPNIVTVYDLGEKNDIVYIAMELLEGNELQNLLKDGKPLPISETLDIMSQVAAGLAYAHEHGIVHRDVKPSNIMVLKSGRVKIADFGIARMESSMLHTQTGIVMGSPLYMSPEQILARGIDRRSDIFAAGILLFKMLTGQMPFTGDNPNSVMYQIVHEAPPKPSALNSEIPEALDDIVAKCLAKNPEERYQDANQLAQALLACGGGPHSLTVARLSSALAEHTSSKIQVIKLLALAILLLLLFQLLEHFLFH